MPAPHTLREEVSSLFRRGYCVPVASWKGWTWLLFGWQELSRTILIYYHYHSLIYNHTVKLMHLPLLLSIASALTSPHPSNLYVKKDISFIAPINLHKTNKWYAPTNKMINYETNSPIQYSLCNRIRMSLNPTRVIQNISRTTMLLQVFIGNTSGEDWLSVVGVWLDGCEGTCCTAERRAEGRCGCTWGRTG